MKEKSVFRQANECTPLLIKLRELKEQNKQEEYMKLRDKLIIKNMSLAKKIANQESIRNIEEISQDDKEQMAIEGLINAIDKFDASKGDFCRYATKTIYRTIISGVGKYKFLDKNIINTIDKINEIKNEYFMTFGRNPNKEEILKNIDLSENQLKQLENFNKLYNMQSYDEYINQNDFLNEENNNYQETIYNNPVINGVYEDETELQKSQSEYDIIEKALVKSQLRELLNKDLEELNPRGKLILELHFGLNGKESMKFSEIARTLKTTENVVKAIFYRTLKELKEADKDLKDFYDER